MASKTSAFALFLIFNFLFFTFASACGYCPPSKPTPSTPSKPTPSTPSIPTPSTPSTPTPTPSPVKCPIDALKLGVCAVLLHGLIGVTIGTPPKEPCCPLLAGLVDLEVAVCLCTAIKANILGINLDIPIDLSLLVNYCGKDVPSGFQCP